jgi:hypothetical protein
MLPHVSLALCRGRALHYMRDDSVVRRHRDLIGIALGAALDEARITDRDLPW